MVVLGKDVSSVESHSRHERLVVAFETKSGVVSGGDGLTGGDKTMGKWN